MEQGSLVQLKSGGPIMTIEEVHYYVNPNHRKLDCIWIDNDGNLHRFKGLHENLLKSV